MPEKPAATGRNGGRRVAPGTEFDLDGWIRDHGVPVKWSGAWNRDGYRYILEECPWNGHADNSAYIVQGAGGWIAAGCQHNSCQGLGWRELREHYEPGAYSRNGKHDRVVTGDWEALPASLPHG